MNDDLTFVALLLIAFLWLGILATAISVYVYWR